MKRRDLSRKHFLSLGVMGSLGLLGACSMDDSVSATSSGSGGNGGSTGGNGATTSGSSGSAGAGGSGGSNGAAGSLGTSGPGGQGGNGGAAGNAGSSGNGGAGGGAGSGGLAGSQDAGMGGGKVDAGAFCMMNPVAAISMNHMEMGNGPHYVEVPLSDIAQGVAQTYQTVSAPGASGLGPVYPQGHNHEISLTDQDFAMLRAGMTVTKRSCDSAHMHQFVLRCGAMPQAGTPTCGTNSCGAPGDPCP